jgi:hypothetical protein
MRSFSLNSPEFHEFVSPPPDPYGWGPRLCREPNFPREPDYVSVMAEVQPSSSVPGTERDAEAQAGSAFKEWLGHLEAGRIGTERYHAAGEHFTAACG